VDFTGNTTITNTAGDLSGSVVHTQANAAAVAQVDTIKIELHSTGGTGNVMVKNMTRLMTWHTDEDTTAQDFVTSWAASYATIGITLTKAGGLPYLVFTGVLAGASFGVTSTWTNLTGDLDCTVEQTTPPSMAKKRIDTITLTGTSGTANILCDDEMNEVAFSAETTMQYTASWHTRGNTEAKRLLQLIADETAVLYSKGRQFVQLPFYDSLTYMTVPTFSMILNIQDPTNRDKVTDNVLIFAANRGTLNVRDREWTIDMLEIGNPPEYDYYIATTGSDSTGDGSFAKPWKTLYKATSEVTTSGKTIYVTAGTYVETQQSALAVGVNIIGAGSTSIIKSNYGVGTLISLTSASEGTDGNQSISYIRMDGDSYAGHTAIGVKCRKNVKIHHCEIEDFDIAGVTFDGKAGSGEPTTYATGNEVYSCSIVDCSGTYAESGGCLKIGGQQDMLIHDNTITRPDRGDDAGFAIKFQNLGFCMGVKIYNNTITVPPKGASTWEFAIELWNCRGGIEIYDNIIKGTLDFGCNGSYLTNDDGGYGFTARIHDNTFGQDALEGAYVIGIDLERNFTGGVYIYKNYFQNLAIPIATSAVAGNVVEDIWIYYNILNNVGRTDSNVGYGMYLGSSQAITTDNFNVWNNVIIANTTGVQPLDGIRIGMQDGTNISIRNNIMQAFNNCGIYFLASTIDVISIENNYNYDNGTAIGDGLAVLTNDTIQNNITTDPAFVTPGSDFHLQAGSGCINTGIDVGLTTDYDGQAVSAPPEIGAYEY
jgi:hypothetical protein